MRSNTDSMISFSKEWLSEGEFALTWHGEYSSEKISGTPQMKFGAVCRIGDARANLMLMANDLSPLMDHMSINKHDYLTMIPVKAVRKDCPYFEIDGQADDGATIHNRFWLVTNNNQVQPYTAVSKKEYLEEAKLELKSDKEEVLAELNRKMPVRPRAVQDAEKQAAIDDINKNYSGASQQMHMRMFEKDYHTDEEYLKANFEKATVGLEATSHLMDSLLTNLPADVLKSPAMIQVSVPAADFTGFTETGEERMLVKMNPAYFSPYLGSEKAQVLLVSWSFAPDAKNAAELDSQLQAKLDATRLRSLLEK
jgi:hypothetical protein